MESSRSGGVVVMSDACHARAVWGRPALVVWWLCQMPVTLEPYGVVPCSGGVVVMSDACHVRAVWGRPVLWRCGGYVRCLSR